MKTRRSEEDLVESGARTKEHQAVLSEWLRSLTRNQMGSARTGSNPVDRVLLAPIDCLKKFYDILCEYKVRMHS